MGSKIPLAIDLPLVRDFQQLLVKRLRGIEIVAEWFFNDNPAPLMAVALVHQPPGGELLYNRAKETRCRGQVKEIIPVSGMIFIDLCQICLQFRIEVLVIEFGRDVIDAAREPLPSVRINLAAGIATDVFRELLSKVVGGHGIVGNPNDCKFAR